MQRVDLNHECWGVRGRVDDYAICAAAFLAAQQLLGRHARTEAPFAALTALGSALPQGEDFDGGALARAWLLNPPIRRLDEALLRQISSAISRGVDPDYGPACLSVASHILTILNLHLGTGGVLSPTLAELMIAGSPVERGQSVACAFPQASHLALRLAVSNPVRFFAGNEIVAITSALLGIGTRSGLSVDVRDPLSRSAFGSRRSELSCWSSSEVEHLFSLPPLGKRYDLGDGGGPKRAEVLQFEELDDLWSKTMITVVTDGFLHRSSGQERRIREMILRRSNAVVTSLPAGVCGAGRETNSTLLIFGRDEPGEVVFHDGRRLAESVARPTQQHLLAHLAALPAMLGESPERHRSVPTAEIEAEAFNLSVERYLGASPPGPSTRPRRSIPMRLDIVAEVIRPQAAKTLPAEVEESFEAHELTTADIVDGGVTRPSKLVRFSLADRDRVSRSAVQSRDIVVCVKGRVGLVGMVPDLRKDGRPWVISQSFAIVRARVEPRSDLSLILAALLTAPGVIDRLQALAGGTSVQMLQMADLRAFEVPMPIAFEEADALEGIREIEKMRWQVEELCQAIRRKQQTVWTTLWGVPAETVKL
ncbi:hypothetical protein V6R86_08430 [Sphingomonas kaistensis]|uniref:DNA methylase adenine-specific domain-containing protein n=1 Tax=Sphingomonas kaistensis TaxID=298708 RepID=A0ABZ2G4B2_9SPHN